MKSIFWASAVVVALSVTMTGCSNDFETLPASNEEVPLQIADGSISADVQTRATVTSGSIGIFRAATNNYSALYNVQYTYNGGWKAASTDIYLSQLNATLYAYHPYNSVTFSGTTATLTAQVYNSAKDMSYATTGGSTVCNKTPNATFAMTRAYSRLRLTIKRHASNYSGTGTISNISFKNGSTFYTSRTLNIASGTLGGSTVSNWTYPFNTTIAAGGTSTLELLVPPQPVGSGLTITLTLDGTNRSATVPADKFTSSNLAAGKYYNIGLEISAAQIIPDGTITGDDFTSQSPSDDYELNIYAVTVDDFLSQDNAEFETQASK